jgi:tRNA/rRNA methyltransferase
MGRRDHLQGLRIPRKPFACHGPWIAQYNNGLLPPNQLERLEVVLVSPRNPLNIGAAARAMANFGLARLSVVDQYAPPWREARSAVGAPELLRVARETSTLSEAATSCTLVIGTGSLTYRKPEQPVVQLPDLAPLVARELARGGRVAIVFGSEKHGMTREDLSICHCLAVIPTHEGQPSMNLGQAVAVCLYEIAARGQVTELPKADAAHHGRCPGIDSGSSNEEPVLRAISGNLDILGALIQEVMEAAGYSPRSMQAANRHDLHLMLRRMTLSALDTRRALGLFRRVLWRLRHSVHTGRDRSA